MSVTFSIEKECCRFVGADNATTSYCAQNPITANVICATNGLFFNGSVPTATSTSAAINIKAGSMRAIILLLMVLAIINTVGVAATVYNVAETFSGMSTERYDLCQR
ncbi:hypothetical protein LIPSTDRAFT_102799 [Lipomyces starkeyi NRRL Y-11557]|uniref:Uncharacterized protein n=1 Tax=Lipomyces starkeyi NRRL Y-11557 TaxID=675824 RepID=A0A1E3QAY7_LIPST|nr:hypothetical protein LIPSTDRAFT_102799 [Lipomyces starkeyi NRRL Y-11557]